MGMCSSDDPGGSEERRVIAIYRPIGQVRGLSAMSENLLAGYDFSHISVAGMYWPFRQVGGVSADAELRPGPRVESVRKEGEDDEGVGIAVVLRSWRPLSGDQANISRRDDLYEATGESMTAAGGARAARDE
ncbi:hypothetical protein FS749_002324 [Ceratobasidium sp. UAMH 11750]|nr:hypothetical protein FS749_002324 [Ceratobasidium sp. UAMH 11750]